MKSPIPLFGFIALSFAAMSCSVGSAPGSSAAAPLDSSTFQTRNWDAWLDKMPPNPPRLHVKGEVYVPNGGTEAKLTRAVPQGINPKILILDLTLVQNPGPSTQALTWVEARYDENPATVVWTEISIRYEGKLIETLKVKTVQ